ncbi:hypothetical protein AAH979_05920 [Plantactinospora sp. ZYX-F-223]|uniref:hypothetical protein n=1 Tax=Plantactinospora sp. ZYX-F-223 TaxID=3144103 RepID=UPI0031FD6574
MKRHITRGIAMTAAATLATLLLSVAPVRATESATYYGPYADEGTCNYWKYAVAATGQRTHGCFYDIGWYFYTY